MNIEKTPSETVSHALSKGAVIGSCFIVKLINLN